MVEELSQPTKHENKIMFLTVKVKILEQQKLSTQCVKDCGLFYELIYFYQQNSTQNSCGNLALRALIWSSDNENNFFLSLKRLANT
jgi:hypothetical protein